MRRTILLWLSFFLITTGMFAEVAVKKKVAILEPVSKTNTITQMQKEMIKATLRNSIASISGYTALDRCNTDLLAEEKKFQQSGQVTDAQRKKIGEMFGAELICVAEVTDSDASLFISVTIIYLESGEIFNSKNAFVEGKRDVDIYNACTKLANDILGGNSPQGGQVSRSGQNQTITVNGVSFDMVYVAGGSFTMGCTGEQGSDCDDDEQPVHQVSVSNFYIGKYEVTQGLWESVMGTTIYQQRDKGDASRSIYGQGTNYPMYYISWEECMEFIRELNRITGKTFSLPTEAQWEYAARGGNKSTQAKFAGASSIDRVAWYKGNSGNSTHPVGQKAPNELGVYDMSGNVWEWCSDWYGDYSSSSQSNPTGAYSGSFRVLRGGSWSNLARYCRVSLRPYSSPSFRSYFLGFRLSLVQ